MRRPAHGGTCRPGPTRPTSGYGRPLGMPGPHVVANELGVVRGHESPSLDALVPVDATLSDLRRDFDAGEPDGDAALDPAVG
jgi:hypothetical protein